MARWLKHKLDGFIYEWRDGLAVHPMLREVTEEEAFPENFIKPVHVAAMKAHQEANLQLDLFTETIPEPPPVINQELGMEAARVRPKRK